MNAKIWFLWLGAFGFTLAQAQVGVISLEDAIQQTISHSESLDQLGQKHQKAVSQSELSSLSHRPHIDLVAEDQIVSLNPKTFLVMPSGTPDFFGDKVIGPYQTQKVAAQGKWALIDPSGWKNSEVQQALAQTVVGDSLVIARNLRWSGAVAWLELWRAQNKVKALNGLLSQALEYHRLMQVQVQLGSASTLEVVRSQNQVYLAQSALADGEQSLKLAQIRLGTLIEKDPSSLKTTDELSAELLNTSLETGKSIELKITNRPENDQIVLQEKALEKRSEALTAAWLPSLNVSGEVALSGRKLNGNALWTEALGVELRWSVWDGGKRQIDRSLEQVDRRILVSQKRDLNKQIQQEVSLAEAQMSSGESLEKISRERLTSTEKELELIQKKAQTGGANSLEVIPAMNAVWQSKMQLIDAQVLKAQSKLTLIRALGRI